MPILPDNTSARRGLPAFGKLCAAFAVALLSTGCVGGAVLSPKLEVEEVRVEPSVFEEKAAAFTVKVTNPNWHTIHISRLDHTLYLNNEYIGRAFDSPAFTLGPKQTVVREVEVLLRNQLLIQKLRLMMGDPWARYQLDTDIYPGPAGAAVDSHAAGYARVDRRRSAAAFDVPINAAGPTGAGGWCADPSYCLEVSPIRSEIDGAQLFTNPQSARQTN